MLKVEDCEADDDTQELRVAVLQLVPLRDPLLEIEAHAEVVSDTVTTGLPLKKPVGVKEDDEVMVAVEDTLVDLITEKEGGGVGEEEGERVVVALCDSVTELDGLPLLLASEALPVAVCTAADGVHLKEESDIPVIVETMV